MSSYSPPSQRKPSPGELCLGDDLPANEEEAQNLLQSLMAYLGPSGTGEDPVPPSSSSTVQKALMEGALDHTYSAYEPSELFEIAPEPESLSDCITDDVLYMDKAAKFIRKQKGQGTFHRADYENFTHSKAATGVSEMDFDGLETVEDALEASRLGFTAYKLQDQTIVAVPHVLFYVNIDLQLIRIHTLIPTGLVGASPKTSGDIMRAQLAQLSRKLDAQNRPLPGSTVSLYNCSNMSRRIEAPPPFKQLYLVEAAEDWIPPRGDIPRQITSLYRYILQDITDPPQCIQNYAIRINGFGGKDRRLENLPDSVLWTLVDFGIDILGLGNEELRSLITDEIRRSSFYLSLGAHEEGRREIFLSMRKEAYDWRWRVWSLLQRALTDIRAYTYDQREQTWIHTRRKATRPIVGNDGSETEMLPFL